MDGSGDAVFSPGDKLVQHPAQPSRLRLHGRLFAHLVATEASRATVDRLADPERVSHDAAVAAGRRTQRDALVDFDDREAVGTGN